MEHKVLDPGTKVRVFSQRIENHIRAKGGWKVEVKTIPERFGVISECTTEHGYQSCCVQFPDGCEELFNPTQLEPYEWD